MIFIFLLTPQKGLTVTNNQSFTQLRRMNDWSDSIAMHLQRIKKNAHQIANKTVQIYIVRRANDLLSLITKNDTCGAQNDQLLTPLLLGLLDLDERRSKSSFWSEQPRGTPLIGSFASGGRAAAPLGRHQRIAVLSGRYGLNESQWHPA